MDLAASQSFRRGAASRADVEVMFTPIRKGAFSWSTPDPADDWMMVGHLFVRETGIVFVDPPRVPGLVEAATKLGKPEAVLLTTQAHTRASNFISKRLGIPLYLPEQNQDAIDQWEIARVKAMKQFEVYRPGDVLGFEAHKFGEDYALLSDNMELLIGDNAVGDSNGNVVLAPDWFPQGPPYSGPEAYSQRFRDSIKSAFKEIVKSTGATSLLASHGYDVIGNLQSRANEL
jgi:hypothetical protein